MSNDEQEIYFEDLATRFKLIGHTSDVPRFCRYDLDEVVSGLRHQLDMSSYCLLLEAPSGQIVNNGGDGHFDDQTVAFLIARTVGMRDWADEKLALSEARAIGLELLGRILHEGRFTDVNENSISYEKVGPVFGNAFGYRFEFVATDPVALVSKAENWQ